MMMSVIRLINSADSKRVEFDIIIYYIIPE